MKKLLIIAAAIFASALMSTSCVETTESASVTDLRLAKAAEMQAYADMILAQNRADSLEAEANAEYLRAQADYQRALAELQRALAEAEAARADSIRQVIEQTRQLFEMELDSLRLAYQKQMLEVQKEIDSIYNAITDEANARVKELFAQYKTEFDELCSLKIQLNNQNINLIKAENDILEAEEYVAERTQELERQIAAAEAKLEVYNSYDGVKIGDIQARIDEIEPEMTVREAELNSRVLECSQIRNELQDFLFGRYEMDYMGEDSHPILKIMDTLRSNLYGFQYTGFWGYIVPDRIYFYRDSIVPELTYNDFGQFPTAVDVPVYRIEEYPRTDYLEFYADYVDQQEQQIEAWEELVGAPAAGTKPATGLYAELADLQKLLADAQKLEDEALIAQYTELIDQKQEEIDHYLTWIATYENNILILNDERDEITRMLKAIDALQEDYEKEVKALGDNELLLSYFQAMIPIEEAYDAWMELSVEYNELNRILAYGIVDFTGLIEEVEAEIDSLQEELENLNNVETAEEAKADIEADIARLTEEIAIQEQLVESIKSALDAALAELGEE